MNLALVIFAAAVLAEGQAGPGFGRMAGNVSANQSFGGAGFGRIVFPGTGAPAAVRTIGPRGASGYVVPQPPPVIHPSGHGHIVPYPVYYSGGYYPYDAPPPVDQSAVAPDYNQSPIVITNQSFHPDVVNPVVRDYSDYPLPLPAPRMAETQRPIISNNNDDTPTIYLIAMKDGTIFASVAYWADGDTLNYVTKDGSINHASLELVDRDFSKQLNNERNVEFKLPAAK
jgi:hypothetical protein